MTDNRSADWHGRYEQCLRYVEDVLRAVNSGKSIALGPSAAALEPPLLAPAAHAAIRPKVVYCAPHPDDSVADFLRGVPEQAHPAVRLQKPLFDLKSSRADVLPTCHVFAVEELFPIAGLSARGPGAQH